VRRAKDHRHVPTRYYRPDLTTCPHCGYALRRSHQRWQKHVVFLHGREWVVNLLYRYTNPRCREARRGRVHTSLMADRLTLRGSSFALEVIVQIGYWRFWQRWTVTQIHEVLTHERHVPISKREVAYLVGVFLVLLRCTSPPLAGCGPGSGKPRAIRRRMTLFYAMENGRCSLILRSLSHKCSLASSNSLKPTSIVSTYVFSTRSNGFVCCTAFATIRADVSPPSNKNGLTRYTVKLRNP